MKASCERQGCKKKFNKRTTWQKYCSATCKQISWALRKVRKSH